MKELTKKYIFWDLDEIKKDMKRKNYTTAESDYYRLRGAVCYMKCNEDLTEEEYKQLNKFLKKLYKFILLKA